MSWWNIMKNAEETAYETYVSGIKNSIASAENRGGGRDRDTNYGAYFAENTEASRPMGRSSRRSVDQDSRPVPGRYQPRRLFDVRGVFSARRPDVQGRAPYERWPERSQPRGGCSIPGCSCGR